jgi:hypothetical protein
MLYAIQAGGPRGPIKLGCAAVPRLRMVELQVGNHEPLELLAVRRGTRRDEVALHERFWGARIRGEWFTATPELMEEIIAWWDADTVWRGMYISQYAVRLRVIRELASEADARELWHIDVARIGRPDPYRRHVRTEDEMKEQAEEAVASNLRHICDQYAAADAGSRDVVPRLDPTLRCRVGLEHAETTMGPGC